jgi:hypothetical protein
LIFRTHIIDDHAISNDRESLVKTEPDAARPVSERELLLFIKSKVVRQMEISQTRRGGFRLRIRLSIDPEDFVLSGTRNKPREWVSLDTLAKQIRTRYIARCPIALSLREEPLRLGSNAQSETSANAAS